ncbi:MAG TPA: 2-dehydropantoate 2-reductase N-terminal domain-containing protein, partial [Mariprofundaceae bacterium]|nr:2-dehydropantoate 2-reductase N-terminal domain-containing protein [Mariprofundaceae bacterium]
MNFLIAGAGAVGSHYGSLLQQAGFEVQLLARGAHLKALQAGGLRHETDGKTVDLELPAGDDPKLALDADVIIFCCKTTGLAAMCEELQPYVPPEVILVTLQNGVTAPDAVQGWFPDNAILAGSAFIGTRLEAPGHVIHSAAGHLRLGHWHGEDAQVLEPVAAAFREAGVDCQVVDDPRRLLWHKMLW